MGPQGQTGTPVAGASDTLGAGLFHDGVQPVAVRVSGVSADAIVVGLVAAIGRVARGQLEAAEHRRGVDQLLRIGGAVDVGAVCVGDG